MTHLLNKIESAGLVQFPNHVTSNLCYLAVCGSESFGVSQSSSDKDLKGFCIPPREFIFPYENRIHLMDPLPEKMKDNKQTKLYHKIMYGDMEYDIEIHYLNKWFKLLLESNPTVIDSLFVRREHVLFTNAIGELIRDNRKAFLSKGAVAKYKGYAYGQLRSIRDSKTTGNRAGLVEKFGYDVKHAYHLVRNLNEIEQILIKGDLDLMENREQYKAIRRGEWTLEQVTEFFNAKEKVIEELRVSSPLRESVDKTLVRNLFFQCVEHHYGRVANAPTNMAENTLREISALLNERGY